MSVEDKISAYRRRKDARKHEALKDDIVEKWRERKDERQKGNAYYNYKKRRAARKAERADARWITVGAVEPDRRKGIPGQKGRHVLIDDEGVVVSGAGGSLTGVKLKGAESTSGDVKVDPKKTSDPTPESPAGEEGKSSGEVAAEAKGSETTSGAEPKEAEVKVDTETLKAVKDNSDELKEWLDAVPEGTEIVFADEDGDIPYKLKKTEGGAWTATYPMSGETDTFSDAANMAADLPVSISAFEGVGGSYKVVAPGEEEPEAKEPETKVDFKITDFGAVKDDDDALIAWLDSAPVGTKFTFMDGHGDPRVEAEKTKYGTWKETDVSDLDGDTEEFDTAEEFLPDLHTGLDTFVYDVMDGKTGEVYTSGGVEKEEPGKLTFEDAKKAFDLGSEYNDTIEEYLNSLPDGTQVKLGAALLEKNDSEFYQVGTGILVGGASDLTDLIDKDNLAGKDFYIIDKHTGKKYVFSSADEKEGGETAGSAESKGKIDIDAFKKAIADEDEEGYAKLLENAPVGTMLVHGEDEFIKKDDGKFYLKGYEDPGSGFDELPIPSAGADWGIVDPTTGEVITLSEATPKASEEKALDIDDLKEKIKYGQAHKGLESLPTGAMLKTGDSKFVKKDDGKFYFVGHEGLGGFDTTAMAYSLSGETVGGWDIKNPKTGEWVPLKDSAEAVVDVEELAEPYKAKTDIGSAITGRDKETLLKHVKEMKNGTQIQLENSYQSVRLTKEADGKWKKEIKPIFSDTWKEVYSYGDFDDNAVVNHLGGYPKTSIDGEKIKTISHVENASLFDLKTNSADAAYAKKRLGLNNKDFATTLENYDGDTAEVVKQDDGTYVVKENGKTKKFNEASLVNYIKNKDFWINTLINEEGWAEATQQMLKKHLAPLKKSLLTAPDKKLFADTLREIKKHSTFQMRNTDGSGFVVRKISRDTVLGDEYGYMVKSIDKDGKIGEVDFFSPAQTDALFDKLSKAAKKGVTFSADKEVKPYVPPAKKTTYKGPVDTSSYASAGKTAGGLSAVKFGEDAYSDAARKGALQEAGSHEGKQKVHDALFPAMQKWWKGLSEKSKSAIRQYTGSYHDTNEPLRGFKYTSYEKDDAHIRNKIKAIDEALDQTETETPIVLTRGISMGTFRAMVDHKSSSYSKWSSGVYGPEMIGKVLTEPSYMSCTAAGAADFSSKPVQLKIYCPAGTKGAYINPISSFGMGLSDEKVENPGGEKPYYGGEFEFLLQRGCKFKIRDITKSGGTYKVDLDLIEQNPRPLTISDHKGYYDDGKDAYAF